MASSLGGAPCYHYRVPELPDVTVYVEAITRHVGGRVLERVRIGGPSLLRSVEPPTIQITQRRSHGSAWRSTRG